jgi:hypothetical protein
MIMKLKAVAVSTSNMQNTVNFYSLVGFKFPEFAPNEQRVESIADPGSVRLPEYLALNLKRAIIRYFLFSMTHPTR